MALDAGEIFVFCFFFYSVTSRPPPPRPPHVRERERKRARKRKRWGRRFETCSKIPGLVVGRNVTMQVPSGNININNNTSSKLHSFW
jgi:hypothetical protein